MHNNLRCTAGHPDDSADKLRVSVDVLDGHPRLKEGDQVRGLRRAHEVLELEVAALQMVLHTARCAHDNIAAAAQDLLLR